MAENVRKKLIKEDKEAVLMGLKTVLLDDI